MPRMLRKALKQLLDQDELEEVCSAFDTIGGIIIIKIPESLNQKKRLIAEVLLQKVNNIYSVFCQTSGVQGDYRLRNLEFLAGINSPITYYKENAEQTSSSSSWSKSCFSASLSILGIIAPD
jgi:tRNA (guanine37-N1)-methyltransferase